MDAAMHWKNNLKQWLITAADLPPVRNILHNIGRGHGMIFMLHRFNSETFDSHGHDPAHVERCLQELQRRDFQLLSVDQMVAAAQRGQILDKAVAITVDDGYLDQAVIGGDLFQRYDCPATFFSITRLLDGDFWPDDAKIAYFTEQCPQQSLTIKGIEGLPEMTLSFANTQERRRSKRKLYPHLKTLPHWQCTKVIQQLAELGDVEIPEQPPEPYRGMSWDDARTLTARGMKIGSHTCHHRVLSAESDSDARTEIEASRQRLQQEIEHPSEVFCYPIGTYQDFSAQHGEMARAAGFSAAVSAEPGYARLPVQQPGDLFSIPRFVLPASWDDFQQCILFVELAKERARALR